MIHIFGWTPTIQEIVFMATTIWAGIKWLMARVTLPKQVQAVLNKIGQSQVETFVLQASGFLDLKTDLEKRAWVSSQIVAEAKSRGIDLPVSWADQITGFVYSIVYKRKAVKVQP